jgi:WD40 repeat protein
VARVFVSHATEDDDVATLVHGWLVADQHDVFLDHHLQDGIGLGEEWESRLHERLYWADAVVCLVTPAYLGSPWCMAEIGVARARGSRLLPISTEPGLTHPLLPALQHTDLIRGRTVARTALREELQRIDGIVGWGWPDGQPPYPGLVAFDAERHRVFFGRKREVGEIAEWLRSSVEQARGAALFLVGPSGCGKSSLLRAGLWPLMDSEPTWWCLPPIVPGTNLVAALTSTILTEAETVGVPDHTGEDTDGAGQLDAVVQEMLKRAGERRRLLIVVDQFEELLTRGDEAGRSEFAELVRPILGRSVQLVVTLRPEFLAPLLAAPELATLPKHVHPIQPLRRDALRSVITEPARLAGLTVDDDLADRLVADTGDGQALPLLAFTLAELATDLRRGDRLRLSHYEQIKGVRGALAKHADEALVDAMAIAGRSEDEVLRGLLRLVAVDEKDQPTRLRVPQDELPEPILSELRPFVERRLLTSDSDQERPLIGVAHEAFLAAWPPLQNAIRLTAAGLRARGDVDRAAAQWERARRPASRLWVGGQLAAVLSETGARLRRSELISERVELGPPARAFLRASLRHDRWLRWRVITVLSVLLVVALLAAGYAINQKGVAEDQQLIATSRQLMAQADAARATDPRTALRLGIAAERLAPSPAAEASLVDTLSHTSYARTLEHDLDVVAVAVAPDGRTLVTGGIDGTLRLWDITDPARSGPIGASLRGHTGYLYSVAFAPDGRTVATASADNTVLLWDIGDPARAHRIGEPLGGHTGGVHAAVFAPRRPLLATAGFDHTVLLWDVTDPARPRSTGPPLIGHDDVVSSVAFTPDGLTMATAGFDGNVVLWDVRDPAAPRMIAGPLSLHTSTVWTVEFAPDGRTLASGGNDGTLGLWDVTDPAQPRGLPSVRSTRPGPVYAAAFAPSGRTLATAGADKTVTLWNIADPASVTPAGELAGHTNNVYALAFTPDGAWLTSGGADRAAILWNLAGPPQPAPLGASEPGPGLSSLAVASDGRTVVTGGASGQLDLWDVGGTGQPQHLGAPITAHTGQVWSVAFSPNARMLVTGGNDGTVRVYDVTDRSRARLVAEPITDLGGEVFAVAFSPDGHTVAAAGRDEKLRLWDLSDPAAPRRVGDALTGHTGAIYTLAYTPDGGTLVSAGADTSVLTWDVTDPTWPRPRGRPVVGHTGPIYSVAFATRGPPLLASAGADSSIILWDMSDVSAPRMVGRPLLGHAGAVYRVGFAPDGRTLISGGADETATLWDLTDPGQPRRLGLPVRAHAGPVNGVQFAGETSRLVTAGGDGRLAAWDLATLNGVRQRPVDAACAVAGRGLDQGEWDGYIPGLGYRDTCVG